MFARVATIFTFLFFILPVLASATVLPRTTPPTTPASQCNTGGLQCCNSTQSDATTAAGLIAGLLGVVLGPVELLLGVTCSPISLIGLGANSCSAQPVCCTNNNFNGVVAFGCNPVNLNL